MNGRGERRRVVAVNVRSAARMGFALSLCLWAVAGVGLLALYGVGAVGGGVGGFRGFLASLGLTGIWSNPVTFVPVFAVVSVAASVVAGVLTLVVAMLYNALVPIVGGVEIVER